MRDTKADCSDIFYITVKNLKSGILINFLFLPLNLALNLVDIVYMKVLRERDGIPDLRRAARFHYAIVTIPEVGFI
jgi:hypothetical protein